MIGWRKAGLTGVVLAAVLALAFCACAPGAAPAEKGKVVNVGFATAFTGPIAATTVPISEAWLGHLKWLNDEGGIGGGKGQLPLGRSRSIGSQGGYGLQKG